MYAHTTNRYYLKYQDSDWTYCVMHYSVFAMCIKFSILSRI